MAYPENATATMIASHRRKTNKSLSEANKSIALNKSKGAPRRKHGVAHQQAKRARTWPARDSTRARNHPKISAANKRGENAADKAQRAGPQPLKSNSHSVRNVPPAMGIQSLPAFQMRA